MARVPLVHHPWARQSHLVGWNKCPSVHDMKYTLGENAPVLVVDPIFNSSLDLISVEKLPFLQRLDLRYDIQTARGLGSKGDVREPTRGITVKMYDTTQQQEDEHYHTR
ncbi:hypothetical protein TNCV_3650011 [Trichonephila clavipes]|nr:hypothetical protein TNCV_3650011 [Trichonephila clavipes]